MDLTARDIHDKQFHDAWRGYDQEEVDEYLDRLAETIEAIRNENNALEARVGELEGSVAASRSTEEMLKKTLVSAQSAAEEAIAKAKARADQLIGEAEERARKADEAAREKTSNLDAEIRRRTLEADREHTTRKRDLDASIQRLKAHETELKDRLRSFLDQQKRALDSLAAAPEPARGPSSRPRPPTARSYEIGEARADERRVRSNQEG
jgi:cell division initiation protein